MKIKMSEYFPECYSGILGIKDIVIESKEVIEALSKRNWQEAMCEISQVALYVLIVFWQITKIDFIVPNCLPWQEDYERFLVWKKILHQVEAPKEFDIAWFNIGNNWQRPEKVVTILEKAGVHVNKKEAKDLINLYK
jgi:hypothetical protein